MSAGSSVCVCGKNRSDLNKVNWQRHIDACKKRKQLNYTTSISKFFKSSISEPTVNPKVINEPPKSKNSVNDYIAPEGTHIIQNVINIPHTSDHNDEHDNIVPVETHFEHSVINKPHTSDHNDEHDYIVPVETNFEHSAINEPHTSDTEEHDNIVPVETNFKHSEYPNDPGHFPEEISCELLTYLVQFGPCQPSPLELPSNMFPKTKDSHGVTRSFHESYYHKIVQNHSVRRIWLSYSVSQDKVYCVSCKLFGLPKARKALLAKDGSNSWKNLKRNLESHEHSIEHLQSEISRGLFLKNDRIDIKLRHSRNQLIAENREVMRAIIEVLIFAARQNIALRGHREDLSSDNRGNFLELIKLMSHHNSALQLHLEKINTNKFNRFSFMSHESQNKLLSIIAEIIRSVIVKKLKKAGLFSVIIDTTTDITSLEQFTFVIRYIYEGNIEERLLSLVTASDATGKGLYDTFCAITDKYKIDWKKTLCAQSYDGAAAMQGQYSGLRTFIQNVNPRAMYVWCFAHLLNLVIVDTLDSTTDIKMFFGDLHGLVTFMRARKRTATFIDCQKKLNIGPNSKDRIKKIKNFSETRWTSHDRVITVIHDKYEALKNALELLSESIDRITSSNANSFLNIISSFQFILILKLMKYIFAITTPASCYLQSKSIDFIQAIQLVEATKNELSKLRSEKNYNELVEITKQFCNVHKLQVKNFKEIRTRKIKQMPGENLQDVVSSSASDRFRVNTFFKCLDQIISSIESRFIGAREILKDLALLSPERLIEAKHKSEKDISDECFLNLSKWIQGIDPLQLKAEYLQFSKSLNELMMGMKFPDSQTNNSLNELLSDDSSSDDDGDGEVINEQKHDNERIRATDIIKILSNFDLMSAFPNLYCAYKALGTIPASSASAERSFSKVKLIKTRLRSTMNQQRLESLMLISCERDIEVNIDDVINQYGLSSSALRKVLMFS